MTETIYYGTINPILRIWKYALYEAEKLITTTVSLFNSKWDFFSFMGPVMQQFKWEFCYWISVLVADFP